MTIHLDARLGNPAQLPDGQDHFIGFAQFLLLLIEREKIGVNPQHAALAFVFLGPGLPFFVEVALIFLLDQGIFRTFQPAADVGLAA